MILACNHISKAFTLQTVINDATFHLEEREKAAIVGINGAGKSTLLKLIVGELTPDSGEVILAKGKTLGYLAQHQDVTSEMSIYETMLEVKKETIALEERIRSMEHEMTHLSGSELENLMESYARAMERFEQMGGYAWKSEIIGVLKGLGFSEEDYERPVCTLSGGQKTRVFLGRLLLSRPDVILLDEPTNHLDMHSIAWLETFLINYPGSVLIVAHDRYFLDRVVTKVFEVEQGNVMTYKGNYSAYAEKKRQLFDAKMRQYLNQQAEIKHQEEVIAKLKSFNREKSIKRAESREKMLSKIEVVEKPQEINASMHITLSPNVVSGNDVLMTEGLSMSFPGRSLFSDVALDIKRGERVAIIGDNGTGKTTLLKLITGQLPADSGKMTLGAKVHVGYYDQEHQILHMEKTLFEELSDAYPAMTNTEIRNILAAFLFTGDDVFKRIGSLSGGERGRVSLAKLMLSECNFLILDEPTNHLDITSREILENALSHYTGTVLFVSHDRYFINQTATRILELTNQTFVNYVGNYDYYLEKKEELTLKLTGQASSTSGGNASSRAAAALGGTISGLSGNAASSANTAGPGVVSENKAQWAQQKEAQAKERKRQNDLAKTEKEIEQLEAKKDELAEQMNNPEVASNAGKLLELSRESEKVQTRLDELYELWESLAE